MTKKIVFSTDALPANLDERARRETWHDVYMHAICPFDIRYLPQRQLSVRFEFAQADAIGFGSYIGTMQSVVRRARDVAADPAPTFHLSFNTGPSPLQYVARGKEVFWPVGPCALSLTGEPATMQSNDTNGFLGVVIPRDLLLERVPNAEELAFSLVPDSTAVRLLRGYLETLSQLGDFSDDEALRDHVQSTVLDLATLVLGGGSDSAELARMRGLRAARARTIVSEIQKGFADPAFSTATLARALGLSSRYINELLQESGMAFTDRVLELRLQKARTLLADRRNDGARVSDIALACGFSDISYFNRCFRRRFGETPTQVRGGGGD